MHQPIVTAVRQEFGNLREPNFEYRTVLPDSAILEGAPLDSRGRR
jgi:hypothetical protein